MEKIPSNKNAQENTQLEKSKHSEGQGQEFQSNNPFLGSSSPLDNPFIPTQLKSKNPFTAQQQSENPFEIKNTSELSSIVEKNPTPNQPQIKLQTKLNIGNSDDKHEQEATKIAKQVVNQETVSEVNQTLNSTTQLKGKSQQNQDTPIESQLNQYNGQGTAIPEGPRQAMEDKFGTDFSNVKIHAGNKAAQLSQQLNARAFTTGQDIYFNQGEFKPTSNEGTELLAHELTELSAQCKEQKAV